MKTDILIVNYNSTDALLNCLDSIKDHIPRERYDVWVWDNGSLDKPERITHRFPRVCLLYGDRNIGFGAAMNRLISKSGSPFVMLLNPDTLVKYDFLSNTLAYFEAHAETGIIGPGIANPDETLQASARAFPNILSGFFGRTSLLTRLFPGNRFSRQNLKFGNGQDPVSVDWVSGACMVVRRAAIDEVGGMDERFFMYWEDADWCRRMWRKRWRVVYFPNISLYHSVGQSSRTRAIRSILEFHKSAYLLYEKYARGVQIILTPFVFWALAMRFYVHAVKLMLRKK